ncbi:cupin domain-containing protein [Mycobacterium sp.]|uniref:cupin domain-containing protein n=1 Tax=Mycobacterium sp. TaxID=1785 RepID=UPI0025F1B064|nr:cupin domain-containing protein [Mycobacterium sp.]
MQSDQSRAEVLRGVASGTPHDAMDVFGPTVEFISGPDDPAADFCVMRGVVPPGVVVPLHSHDDDEDFLILAGTQQVLVEDAHGLGWRDLHAGDYVHIPGGIVHAHRNVSDEPVVDLIITSTRLGRFFRELARPDVGMRGPLTPEDLGQLIALSAKYGYVLGTPEQNAAVGIELRVA